MIYSVTHPNYDGQRAKFLEANDTGLVRGYWVDGQELVALVTQLMFSAASAERVDDGTPKILTAFGPLWSDVRRELSGAGFMVTAHSEPRSTPPNERIALFCRMYKEHHDGLAYKVTKADAGKIKHVAVNEPLLRHYFTSDNFLFKGKHSIGNLVRYYNELRAEMHGGASTADRSFPNHYDRAFEKALDGAGITAYRKHLRSLGLVPVTDRSGRITDWMKDQ